MPRVVLVVEGHAGADDVEHRQAAVAEGGLDELTHLFGVTGEGAGNEAGACYQGFDADVDWWEVVVSGVLQLLVTLGRGRELTLGKPVDAVVLDDVDHPHVAPDEVLELPKAYRAGIAITADADGAHGVVRLQGTGAEGG